MKFSLKPTRVGTLFADFQDVAGKTCIIQESSTSQEDEIWLGVDLDIHGEAVPYGRMLLSRQQVKELLPLLQTFARTGSLRDSCEDPFGVGTWVHGIGDLNQGITGRVIYACLNDLVVQDDAVPGVQGQHICLRHMANLVWEPFEKLEHVPTRYELMTQDEE